MKFKLESLIKEKEESCGVFRQGHKGCCLPSVSDNMRKAYYKRPKLTLSEKWNMFWSDKCYPLR